MAFELNTNITDVVTTGAFMFCRTILLNPLNSHQQLRPHQSWANPARQGTWQPCSRLCHTVGVTPPSPQHTMPTARKQIPGMPHAV